MPQNTSSITPEQIVEIVLKWRWLIIIPFILSMVAGIYLALTLPKIYQSQTLILVEPQRVPSDFIRSVVSSDINERISTISQQIMSRTNLEKIISQFGLFSGPEAQDMYLEDKIESLRRRIDVKITSDRRKDTEAFAISYKGRDPETVMRITNTLATYFIDENLKVREAQAIGTSDFLQAELDIMRKRLSDMEESLKIFRTEHMGELPEQLETNLRVLERLQEELNAKQLSIRDAKQLQISLEKQITDERGVSAAEAAAAVQRASGAPATGELRLQQLNQQLADLQTRYTERHPDIIRLKKQIADAEKELAQPAGTDETGNSQTAASGTAAPLSNASLSLERRLAEIRKEIGTLEFDIANINKKIEAYQQRVEQTPKIEQELLSLRRDYDNIKNSYDSLLQRKLEAELAVNMEKKQKGEQFHILDPARVPTKPLEPDMQRLFLMACAAGFLIGGGVIFLLEYMNSSFRNPEQVEAGLDLKVVATIPLIETAKYKWMKRINLGFTVVAVVVALGLFSGFASLTLIGEKQTVEYVRKIMPT